MEGNSERPFDIGSFTQEKKISDVVGFKENIKEHEKPGQKGKGGNIVRHMQKPERDNDKPVPEEEKEKFVNEFVLKILKKAEEFGISEKDFLDLSRLGDIDPGAPKPEQEEKEKKFQEELEKKAKEINVPPDKLKKLTEFDLDAIDELKLQEIKRGDFEFYKKDFDDQLEAINPKKTPALSTEIIANHKGKISLAQLGLYLSAFGMPAIKELSGAHDMQVNIYGKDISLEDLAKNSKLIKEIDQFHNGNTPIDILKNYQAKELEYNNTNLKLDTKVDVGLDNTVQKSIYFANIGGNLNDLDKLNKDLKNLNLSFQYKDGGVPLETFIKDKDKISETIAKDLNIPKEVISKYIEQYLMPDTSKISVVPLNEFKINKDLNFSKNGMDLTNKQGELFQKYNVYSPDGFNGTNWLEAMNELQKWGRENGILNAT